MYTHIYIYIDCLRNLIYIGTTIATNLVQAQPTTKPSTFAQRSDP